MKPIGQATKGLNGTMTDEINYQALYEQLSEENEKLRERITKIAFKRLNFDMWLNTAQDILRNGYFWCGYFVAIIVMLCIGAFRLFIKEV